MKLILGSIALIGAFSGGGMAVQSVKPHANPDVQVAGLDAHETHGSVSLLGQFRTSVSGWLWVRTDLYLHNGVQMRPMLEQEKARNVVSENSTDGLDAAIGHEAVVTVIPSRERDFRGIFGEIERATSSYKDMRGHDHNDPKGALPLFRLMTWVDPQFIPGWTVGANIMCREKTLGAYRKALGYLGEGLEHNGENIVLLKEMAYIQVRRLEDLKAGKSFLDRARRVLAPVEIGRLDADTQDGARDTYRWLVLVNRDLGLRQEAAEVAAEGLTKFPDDFLLATEIKKLTAKPIRRDATAGN